MKKEKVNSFFKKPRILCTFVDFFRSFKVKRYDSTVKNTTTEKHRDKRKKNFKNLMLQKVKFSKNFFESPKKRHKQRNLKKQI